MSTIHGGEPAGGPGGGGTRCLVGFVGLQQPGRAYQRITYRGLSGQAFEASFAPVAIGADLRASGWTPTEVRIFSTRAALRASMPLLAHELEQLGLPSPTGHEIPLGIDAAEIETTAGVLRDQVPAGSEVVLDITHGFRHLPAIALSALAVLRVASDVGVRHVRYGALDGRNGNEGVAPILDLTWTLTASDLAHAVQAFRDSGEAAPLSELLRRGGARPGPEGERSLEALAERLRKRMALLGEGLALDAMSGYAAPRMPAEERGLAAWSALAAPLVLEVLRTVDRLCRQPVGTPKGATKRALPLSREILDQQGDVVRWLLETQRVSSALRLMREWVVNRVLWARGVVDPGRWLLAEVRKAEAEVWLARLRRRPPAGAPACWGPVSALWSELANRRNPLAHAGHLNDEVHLTSQADVSRRVRAGGSRGTPALRETSLVARTRGIWDALVELDASLTQADWSLRFLGAEAEGDA